MEILEYFHHLIYTECGLRRKAQICHIPCKSLLNKSRTTIVSPLTVAVDLSMLDVCGGSGYNSVPMLIGVIQRYLQNLVKDLIWSFLRKLLTALSRWLFLQKVPS